MMMKKGNFRLMVSMTLAAIIMSTGFLGCSRVSRDQLAGVTRITLGNGMQVILKENHASPMVTSLIFVKAGSKYEDRFNNGATHFLEHLLFNGTANLTQQQLDHGIERLGGYINAFTTKEFTAYLVSMPREFIEYGMATQADMLFNSIFPEELFAKERGIVTEEIKMNYDAEGAPAEAFFEQNAMTGTSYSRPVIGYESTIANIPREAIIDYYKRFYAPNNMIALILGDFDSGQMTNMVRSIFGQFQRVELPPAPDIPYTPVESKQAIKTAAAAKSTYIKYSIEAPHFMKPGYFAFALLEDYLSDRENSPLAKALKTGPDPLVTNVSAYLDTKEEFSRLNIDIITRKANLTDSIIALTDGVLQSLADSLPSADLLNGYKVTRRCHEIYMAEKLHHYGFTIAPLMAITGWDFFARFQDNIDSVRNEDIRTACDNYLRKPACVATVVYPQSYEDEPIYQPSGPSSEEVIEYYGKTEFPEYDLTAREGFELPEVGPVSTEGERRADYLKEVLENGLTIVVKSSPDSRVFALNVIGQNRSATEPPGKDGITDFVNR
ncbi:MAG: insulinase family protein, partial [Candidatus Zixiibacteriota bacterium]